MEYRASRFAIERAGDGVVRVFAVTVPLSDAWDLRFEADIGFHLDSAGLQLATDPKTRAEDLSDRGWLVWSGESIVLVIGDESPQVLRVDLEALTLDVMVNLPRWDEESGYTQLRCDLVEEDVVVQYEYGSFRVISGPAIAWHVLNPWGYFPDTPGSHTLRREYYNGGAVEIRLSDGHILERTGPDDLWDRLPGS